jgi:hypothetical protein
MVLKALLIVMVILVLMEDTTSIKKSAKEEEEERELAEAVNKTLAEEEKKRQEEEKKKEDGKRTGGQEDEDERGTVEKKEGQDEACPPINYTCPSIKPCSTDKDCLPCENCKPCKDCEICPEVRPCQPCKECPPVDCPPVVCLPCPSRGNSTVPSTTGCPCPEGAGGMTVPVAMAVGAAATLLATGVAAVLGLLFRYVPPLISGFLFLTIVIMVWFLSSRYPEVARETGGRLMTILREATVALGHRIMETLRHQEQVCFLTNLISF